MKNSDSRYWLIPLLAALAIYVPLSSIPPSPDQQPSAQPQFPALVQLVPLPTPTPAPAPAQDRVSGEAAKLLCDFFGSKQNLDQAGPPDFDPKNLRGDYCQVKSIPDLNKGGQPVPGKYEIEYLIATVPDPKDSRLDHLFDRSLDAIQRAIEAADYTFDRYWLPWDRSRTAAPGALPTDPRAPQMAMATRHLYEPGVILFRGRREGGINSNGGDNLLLLFLVGETPTGGINKVAFQYALWQIEELAGWKKSKTEKGKELRILSPSFSGSGASLAILLKAWIHEYKNVAPPNVRIVSGSAMAADQGLLENITPEKVVSFQATVIKQKLAKDEFYKYLKDRDSSSKRDDDGPQVAMLSEADTVFGRSARPEWVDPTTLMLLYLLMQKEKPTPTPAPTPRPTPTPMPTPTPTPAPLLELSLTFPLHISQLRIEAAKLSLQRDEVAKAKALAAEAPDLALPMREAGSPTSRDIVPLFSPVETVTMDLALDEALSAIRRERIRYVGVTATDVQDRIYLVREIRKQCPNAMIFIFNNDLLYLHSESNLDFRGALVISPYPLFGLNQLWTYPFDGYKRRLQFPTQAAQGLYNATLALLNRKDRPLEDRMLEYGSPLKQYKDGDDRYPALWLGIVGRNGIWPVTVFDGKNLFEEASYTLPVPFRPDPQGKEKKPELGLSGNYWSPTGFGILLLIGGVCLFLLLVLLIQSILIKEGNVRGWLRHFAWVRRGWLGQVFGDEKFYRYRLERHFNLMSCRVILVTITLFISGVAILPVWIMCEMAMGKALKNMRDLAPCLIAAMILMLSLAFLCWLTVSIIRWMISERRRFRRRIGAVLALGVGAAMITFVILGLIEIFRAEAPEQIFFFLRATELASGVSVLLPALLIGLAAFLSFFTALRRLNLAERMPCLRKPQQRPGNAPQFLYFEHERTESFKGLKDLEDRVKEMIVCHTTEAPGAARAVVVIYILYWLLFLHYFIPSVDGRWFDCFFKLGFFVVPMLLAWAFLRVVCLWAALRRLLRRLSWHPLISQYAAEHSEDKRFASLPRVDLMTPTPTYTALSASARQARSFYNALKLPREQAETVEQIRGLVEEAQRKLRDAHGADAKGDWQRALRNRRDAQGALAKLTKPVTTLLEDSWRKSDGSGLDAVWRDKGKSFPISGQKSDGARPDAAWRDEGKFFLITHIIAFLQHIFAQLQNLVALVTVGLLLLLVAATSYPFRPSESLLLFSWVAILTSVVVTLFIFVQVNRDKTLELLTGKTPGKLNITPDFVFRVLFHVVVPLIALLGAQFPQAVSKIFSWLSVFEGKGG